MDDLTKVGLCAAAMGISVTWNTLEDMRWSPPRKTEGFLIVGSMGNIDGVYDPLHDDAQCFDLIERLGLTIYCERQERGMYWEVDTDPPMSGNPHGRDLNAAVVSCVALMQQAKEKQDG